MIFFPIQNGIPGTPKLQIPITCNGTGSVKRQAPKPPSPKIIAPSPLFTAPVPLEDNLTPVSSLCNTLERPSSKCESPLVSGQRDAISFLAGDASANKIRRKLNLDAVAPPNRSSLNLCVSPSPNGTDTLKRYSTFTGELPTIRLATSQVLKSDVKNNWILRFVGWEGKFSLFKFLMRENILFSLEVFPKSIVRSIIVGSFFLDSFIYFYNIFFTLLI